MTVPFNFSTRDSSGQINFVNLDEDELFEKVVVEGQGGTCWQSNRLFYRLLGELGYDVTLMAASTVEGRTSYGIEIEHMFIRAALDGDEWLVDVGYPGPSYLQPLLVSDAVQTQYGCQYRLADKGDGQFDLERCGQTGRWSGIYTFRLLARQWEDWSELEHRARQYPAPPPTPKSKIQNALYGRAFENGQVVLKGRRYLTVRDGQETVRTIVDNNEHGELVAAILSGNLH
jgi:amide synthase